MGQRLPQFVTKLIVEENTDPDVSVVLNPPVVARVVRLGVVRRTTKEIEFADVEVYGGGFVKRAVYESDIIELDAAASLGEIRWAGRRDPHARVAIRTRTGTDPQPEVFYEFRPEHQDQVQFLQGGGDLSYREYKRQYSRLVDYLKPENPLDTTRYDTKNWSFWSSPYEYDDPGVQIVAPEPRKFIQLQAEFLSTVDHGSRIDFIEFRASAPPAVRALLGEIFPIGVEIGVSTQFTYYIKPTIRSGDGSFDGVEISTPWGVDSVDSLRLDGIDQADWSWTTHGDGLGFDLVLPRKLDRADNGALVEVVFTAPIVREAGTSFDGRVFDTANPDQVRQRVAPGNASDSVKSDRLSVSSSLIRSLVFSMKVAPNPFSPNGDAVNDAVEIAYRLLRVTAAVPVAIEIFDLSGRRIKRVHEGRDPIGDHRRSWDGRDHSNRLVPPGLYVCRLVAELQSERETVSIILSVAY